MSDSSKPIRVRFAPSPTGYLHVGGVRTLLFNWLLAKKHHGTAVLRIEDTDRSRSKPEHEKMILEDIHALGFDFDESPSKPGEVGPYRQSERMDIYANILKQLISERKVYFCFCTQEELEQKREAALKMGKQPVYDGTCAKHSLEEAQKRVDAGEKASLRFRTHPEDVTHLEDLVRGSITFPANSIGDFLVTRSPGDKRDSGESTEIAPGIGFPVYNFVCVVDDALMKMTHVLRGEDHLSNTAKQLMIYKAMGYEVPKFAHIPMVLGADRQKLSKRSGDVSAHEYIKKGYFPEALINFLALLGWWPGKDFTPKSGHPEIISVAELIEQFDTDRIQKAPAVFDVQKLDWMNSFYLKAFPIEEVVKRAKPFFQGLEIKNDQWFSDVLEVVRSEVNLLSELPVAAKLFFESEPSVSEDAKALLTNSENTAVVNEFETELKATQDLSAESISNIQKAIGKKLQKKGKALFMPIRALVTGQVHGPELAKIISILGKDAVLERITSIKKTVGL